MKIHGFSPHGRTGHHHNPMKRAANTASADATCKKHAAGNPATNARDRAARTG